MNSSQGSPSEEYTYFVGIQYENPYDEYCSYFEIQRKVILTELAEEIIAYKTKGRKSCPTFPASANPKIWFCFNFDEDLDATDLLLQEIENLILKKAA